MWSVFFIFLSYLDTNVINGDLLSGALDAEKEGSETFSALNGTMCAKMFTVGENFIYLVSDGAEAVRSVVSPTGKLVNCSVIVNQMQVKSFMRECRLGLKERSGGQHMEARFARLNEAKLMCWEFKKKAAKDDGEDSAGQEQVLKRSKRGFTYPGTLWCGAGNMADTYNQLGRLKSFCLNCPTILAQNRKYIITLASLQESLQRLTAAVAFMTTALMSSTRSPQTMVTPISSGTLSVIVTVIMRE